MQPQPWYEWAIEDAPGTAVSGAACSLVDIGANTQTWSDGKFWGELVRAGSAGVAAIVLTGTSVKKVAAASARVEQHKLVSDLVYGGEGDVREPRSAELRSVLARLRVLAPEFKPPQLVYTAGVHPHEAKHATDADFATFESLLQNDPACVAVGECGLDYDRMFSPRDTQLAVFRRQLAMAVKVKKSVFIHERDRDASKGSPLGSFPDLLRCIEEELGPSWQKFSEVFC